MLIFEKNYPMLLYYSLVQLFLALPIIHYITLNFSAVVFHVIAKIFDLQCGWLSTNECFELLHGLHIKEYAGSHGRRLQQADWVFHIWQSGNFLGLTDFEIQKNTKKKSSKSFIVKVLSLI